MSVKQNERYIQSETRSCNLFPTDVTRVLNPMGSKKMTEMPLQKKIALRCLRSVIMAALSDTATKLGYSEFLNQRTATVQGKC